MLEVTATHCAGTCGPEVSEAEKHRICQRRRMCEAHASTTDHSPDATRMETAEDVLVLAEPQDNPPNNDLPRPIKELSGSVRQDLRCATHEELLHVHST